MTTIGTLADLRQLYPEPTGRAVTKQLSELEVHSRRFIELSPFVVMASVNTKFETDASPRGGEPGFIKIVDDHTVLVPDSAGNNRLDTFENIISTGKVSLLFMIPGVNETLRINGLARLCKDDDLMGLFSDDKHPPKMLVEVTVVDAFLHCPKAYMRSRLWETESRIERKTLPSLAQMIRDQTSVVAEVEDQQEAVERYTRLLQEEG